SAVMVAAGGFLVAARKLRHEWTAWGLIALAVLAFSGAYGARRVDCAGRHRNALVAFVESTLPRVRGAALPMQTDWRAESLEAVTNRLGERSREPSLDLTRLRSSAAGRNVILIALESTGARYLRCYGAKEDPMPNLTRLAATSLLFENAYAVYPESIKG